MILPISFIYVKAPPQHEVVFYAIKVTISGHTMRLSHLYHGKNKTHIVEKLSCRSSTDNVPLHSFLQKHPTWDTSLRGVLGLYKCGIFYA